MTEPSSPLTFRFGGDAGQLRYVDGYSKLLPMIERGSCRSFQKKAVGPEQLKLLCAAALASPTKSDLQQRDIIVLQDPAIKAEIVKLLSGQSWISDVPCLLVFCGNNRRQRRIHELRNHPFANDHLDAFFNAAVDAGVALSAFVTAAEALGLGCCPISAIRNAPDTVSELLGLPQHVFPVAGLGVGHPAADAVRISPRLPLSATVHHDRYDETTVDDQITAYDERRNSLQPYAEQRAVDTFGIADSYGWSEDKARQYGLSERQDFGRFIKAKGFRLE